MLEALINGHEDVIRLILLRELVLREDDFKVGSIEVEGIELIFQAFGTYHVYSFDSGCDLSEGRLQHVLNPSPSWVVGQYLLVLPELLEDLLFFAFLAVVHGCAMCFIDKYIAVFMGNEGREGDGHFWWIGNGWGYNKWDNWRGEA
jgi:hypothetical protein